MDYKTIIDGHTFELRTCSTGSIDPWSYDYADENNISLMVSSDSREFILVDGDDVFKLKHLGNLHAFIKNNIKTYDEAKDWLTKYADYRWSLKGNIQRLKEFEEKQKDNRKQTK